ncbi:MULTISPECIES: STAS domain-containing protein [unclassified Streptomyces]|uniref:STAS domain-containing protein n=1 Tax=unclassified Streptomyces TaxID=2593676 RepID=UPI0013CECEF3|nr:STAS domain-containing protein [Streptomyces sp. Tu 4128]
MEITDGAQEGFVVSGRWQDDVLEVTAEDMTVSGRGVLRMLRVAGEVDIDTAPVLRDGLNQAAADRPYTVVVDLSGLAFGDSSTLNTLIEARRRLPALVIAGPLTPMVQRLFTLSGLDGFFTTAPDTETAIRQLTAP